MNVALLVLSIGVALSGATLLAQRAVYKRRLQALEALLAVAPRFCRSCGCTDAEACLGGCWWAEEDLCSSCADDDAIRPQRGAGIVGVWIDEVQNLADFRSEVLDKWSGHGSSLEWSDDGARLDER